MLLILSTPLDILVPPAQVHAFVIQAVRKLMFIIVGLRKLGCSYPQLNSRPKHSQKRFPFEDQSEDRLSGQ